MQCNMLVPCHVHKGFSSAFTSVEACLWDSCTVGTGSLTLQKRPLPPPMALHTEQDWIW